MDGAFNLNEVKDICFSLSIDVENLGGERKLDKIRELILACSRQDKLDDLLAHCRAARPLASWPEVSTLRHEIEPEQLFGRAVRKRILGDFDGAYDTFLELSDIDPYYPGLRSQIRETRQQLTPVSVQPYIPNSSSASQPAGTTGTSGKWLLIAIVAVIGFALGCLIMYLLSLP
jgi:hypothetical protein